MNVELYLIYLWTNDAEPPWLLTKVSVLPSPSAIQSQWNTEMPTLIINQLVC